jgi:hypothetical protein
VLSLPGLGVWDVRVWAEGRAHRIGQLLGAICLMSGSDLLFTLWAHRFTAFHELNPLARAMLQSGQIGSLVVFKLALTLGAAAIFWRLRDRCQAEVGLWAMAVVYLLLTMRWADYTAMAQGIGL